MIVSPNPYRTAIRRRMRLALRGAAIIVIACGLSGCYVAKDGAAIPNDYRKRHPIAIEEGKRTLEIFTGSKRGGLMADQHSQVTAFAQDWRREATGGVIAEMPKGAANEKAAAYTLRDIRAIFSRAGLPAKALLVRSYYADPADGLAPIRLHYPKIVARAGPCGLWPHDLGPAFDPFYQQNRPHWNLGCANQRNLAAMVENPADLVQPRAETGIYAARRSNAIEKYRKGEDFSGKYPEAYDKSKLSDLGK